MEKMLLFNFLLSMCLKRQFMINPDYVVVREDIG